MSICLRLLSRKHLLSQSSTLKSLGTLNKATSLSLTSTCSGQNLSTWKPTVQIRCQLKKVCTKCTLWSHTGVTQTQDTTHRWQRGSILCRKQKYGWILMIIEQKCWNKNHKQYKTLTCFSLRKSKSPAVQSFIFQFDPVKTTMQLLLHMQ